MSYYKLIRQAPEGRAVRGTLCEVEHRYSGSTGQYKEYLTPVAATLENKDYLIPALVYKVTVTQSPRFKRLMPVLCQVPGRAGIRIHRGTIPEHSKGCILVPDIDTEKSITTALLKEQSSHEEIRLEICNI